jgi:phosphatidylserine decarboxylase
MSIAREGLREISIATVLFLVLSAAAAIPALLVSPWYWIVLFPLFDLWMFAILFFRDPRRQIPDDPGVLVSPADGKVTEITRLTRYDGFPGPALRIGIFLSVFDVHINRIPCAGRVERTDYRPGEFLDARHPECGVRNEANTVVIDPHDSLGGPVVIRQIAGLIARRIICNIKTGDRVERGQRLGLIKFGSRTELIVSADCGLEPAIQINDHVTGGQTVLLRPRAGGRTEASSTSARQKVRA